ncbi:MAG: M1 family metallopeptidase, partial [Planctomycetes bacterium]|nr:M1 family metallopeptidase [Planctomycetota bacterium]
MRTETLLLVAALGCAAVSPGQEQPALNVSGGPLRADQACYDVRHYTLRIDVDPEQQAIDAELTMRADATDEVARLALDLDQRLAVSSLLLDGSAAPFEHEQGRIVVTPPAPIAKGRKFEVRVAYAGKPVVAPRPPWSGGFTWAKTPRGAHWIATSCQGEGADLWWPCKDHPSDKPDGFDLHCTVPEGLVCASNGVLQGEPKTEGGKTTFHWRTVSPIANYNIALNIAPYVVLRDTFQCVDGTEMPIAFYVLPSSERKAKRCMIAFLDHITVFEQLLGPYPFRHEKYGIAETPHLGMEHQTIIAYGNGFREEQYDWLHNHELSHEWWGNLVTCRDWKDMWLHEGFGTYMQPLYREVRFGRKAYETEIHRHRTMNRAPIAPREVKDSKQIYFGGGGGNHHSLRSL